MHPGRQAGRQAHKLQDASRRSTGHCHMDLATAAIAEAGCRSRNGSRMAPAFLLSTSSSDPSCRSRPLMRHLTRPSPRRTSSWPALLSAASARAG
jgi:hypothetical protein